MSSTDTIFIDDNESLDSTIMDKARKDEKDLLPYTELNYLKPLNTDIYYVQEWFKKAAWKCKLEFCTKLFYLVQDSDQIMDLVYFIGTPGKDIIYTREQYTKSSYDICPMDHNRSLAEECLAKVKLYYINWFKSQREHHQFQILIGLLQIGGSALQEKIYEMSAQVLVEREDMLAKKLEEEKRLDEKRKLMIKIEKQLALKKKKKMVKKKHKQKLGKAVSSKQASKISLGYHSTLIDLVKNGKLEQVFLGPKVDTKARAELAKVNQQWKKYLTKVELTQKTQHFNYSDKIQMLPLWVNRKIIHELPESSHNTLSKVNAYWRDMINNVRKESKARRVINFAITSIESEAPVYRTKFIEAPKDDEKKTKSRRRRIKRSKSHSPRRKKISSSKKSHSAQPSAAPTPENQIRRANFSNYYYGFEKDLKYDFSKYSLSVICNEYALNRIGDASSRWIIYSHENNLKLLCTTTGAPATIEIQECHNEPITCVALHPNKYQVFTGSYDGEIKLFDIWSKQPTLTFIGHDHIITSIHVNEKYLASCTADSYMKVFKIRSGLCILTLELQEGMPTKICLDENDSVYIGNNAGKLLMVNFIDTGNPAVLQKDIKYGIIPHAHLGEITCLSTYPLLVISGGIDGFARIWDADMSDPHWISSFKHKTRVNCAVVSFLKLFTACENGVFYIWNIGKCTILRKIEINLNGRPILGMTCLEEPSYIKFVMFSELDVTLLEIEMPWKKYEESKLKNITRAKTMEWIKMIGEMEQKMTKTDIDMMRLHYRRTILEELRNQPKCINEQKPSTYSLSALEVNEIRCFPRTVKNELVKLTPKRNFEWDPKWKKSRSNNTPNFNRSD